MWDSLKKILKTSNEKAVIVEDGEPKYVILSVDEYLRLSGGGEQSSPLSTQNSPAPKEQNESVAPSLGGQPSGPSVTPKGQASDSIFTEPIHPSASEAPVDLADIDSADKIELADSKNNPNEINLDDLPL